MGAEGAMGPSAEETAEGGWVFCAFETCDLGQSCGKQQRQYTELM